MNTKPNRDITAEEPTTSTEWAEELYKVFYDETYKPRSREYIKRYDRIKDFISQLLTTRTDELLGAMKMEYKEEEIAGGIMGKRFSSKKELYNDAVDEFNEKLATLKDKYEK